MKNPAPSHPSVASSLPSGDELGGIATLLVEAFSTRVEWLAFTPDGIEWLDSPGGAKRLAAACLEPSGEWPEGIESVSWGGYIPLEHSGFGRAIGFDEFFKSFPGRAMWVASTPDGFEELSTAKDAQECAQEYPDEPGDGESVSWGLYVPVEQAAERHRVETPGGDFDYQCDYVLVSAELEELERLERFLDFSASQFALAIVCADTVEDRVRLEYWLRNRVAGRLLDFGLDDQLPDRLREAGPQSGDILMLTGLDSCVDGNFRTLNSRRDPFMAEAPVPWILVGHRRELANLHSAAPDFCGMASAHIDLEKSRGEIEQASLSQARAYERVYVDGDPEYPARLGSRARPGTDLRTEPTHHYQEARVPGAGFSSCLMPREADPLRDLMVLDRIFSALAGELAVPSSPEAVWDALEATRIVIGSAFSLDVATWHDIIRAARAKRDFRTLIQIPVSHPLRCYRWGDWLGCLIRREEQSAMSGCWSPNQHRVQALQEALVRVESFDADGLAGLVSRVSGLVGRDGVERLSEAEQILLRHASGRGTNGRVTNVDGALVIDCHRVPGIEKR